MSREDFSWLLWGIGIALTIQVLYDAIGEILRPKYLGGLLLSAIFWIALTIYISSSQSKQIKK